MTRRMQYGLWLLAIVSVGTWLAGPAEARREPQIRVAEASSSVVDQIDALFEALAIKRPEQQVIAPDVPLTDTQGNRRSLKEFRGKIVLVNFWATWCVPCLTEMPELSRPHAAYQDKGFVVVAISTDSQGPEYVRKYVAEKQFRFLAFSDPDGIRAGIPFRLVGIPASYLIGADGELLGSLAGPRNWASPEAMALIGKLTDALRRKP